MHDGLATRTQRWSAQERHRATTAHRACAVLPDSPAALDASNRTHIEASLRVPSLRKRRRRRAEGGGHWATLEWRFLSCAHRWRCRAERVVRGSPLGRIEEGECVASGAERNLAARRPYRRGDAGTDDVVRILHSTPRTAAHTVPVALSFLPCTRPTCVTSECAIGCPCAQDVGEREVSRYEFLTSLTYPMLTDALRASASENLAYIEVL